MRRRAEVLEVFLLLKATDCHSLRHLKLALEVRGLPQTLESARLVAEYRQVVLTEISTVVAKISRDLDLPFDHGRDTSSCFVIAGLLNRVRADTSLRGANAAVRALTDLHRRTVARLKTGPRAIGGAQGRQGGKPRDHAHNTLWTDDSDSLRSSVELPTLEIDRSNQLKGPMSRTHMRSSTRTHVSQWGTPRSSLGEDTSSSSNQRWSPAVARLDFLSPRRLSTCAQEPFRSRQERAAEEAEEAQVEMSVFASPVTSPVPSPGPSPRDDRACATAERHAQRRRMQRPGLKG